MNIRRALVLILIGCPTLTVFGRACPEPIEGAGPQDIGSFSKPKASPTNRVTAMPPRPVHIQPGGKANADLAFQVKHGFHINSNKPGSDLLVPTVVKLDPPTDIAVGGLQYPEGHDFSLSADPTEKLNVYTGDFTVTAIVAAAKKMPPGRYRIHGMLKYQACDDRACYPPAQLPIAFDVQVGKAASTRVRRNPPQSPHVHN